MFRLPANLSLLAFGLLQHPIILIIIAIVVVLGVVMPWTIYDGLVRSQQRMLEAWSGIDVQLKRRSSLIPNLVETVKGYAAHEHGVFEDVARARSAFEKASGAQDSSTANTALSQALGRLFAVAERYPTLQASTSFLELQRELADVEGKIAYARQFYNQNVLDYSTRMQTFPGVILARGLGFKPASFFEAEPGAQTDVKVDFGASRS